MRNGSESPTQIKLWREGHWLYVDSSCEELLKKVLRTRKIGPNATDGATELRHHDVELFEVASFAGKPILKVPAGLTQLVLAVLRLTGRHPTVDRSVWHEGGSPPDRQRVADWPLVKLVCQHDRGLIRYASAEVPPLNLCRAILDVFRGYNCTILVHRRDDVVPFVRGLRKIGFDAYGHQGKSQDWVEKRVAVATTAGMANNPIEPEKQHVVIVANAARAIASNSNYYLPSASRARLYGLLDLDHSLSPYERDQIRCLFGFEEIEIPRHGHVVRPVTVHWIQPRRRGRPSASPNLAGTLRRTVWQNDARNRDLAHLGRLLVGEASTTSSASMMPQSASRTFVIVENIEHSLALLNKLPGWPLFASPQAHLSGLTANEMRLIESRLGLASNSAPCGVVTHAGLFREDFPCEDTSILIRGDAGEAVPLLPERMLVRRSTVDLEPLVMIDLYDREGFLRKRARRRAESYLAAGWAPRVEWTNLVRMYSEWRERIEEVR